MRVNRRGFLKGMAALAVGLLVNPRQIIADAPLAIEDDWELEGREEHVEHLQHLLKQSESTEWGKMVMDGYVKGTSIFITLPEDSFAVGETVELLGYCPPMQGLDEIIRTGYVDDNQWRFEHPYPDGDNERS